jgi:hypothetical protein
MSLVRVPGCSKRRKGPRVLSAAECQKLLAHLQTEPYRTMLMVAMSLGLRCSEWAALVDFDAGTISINRAIVVNRVDEVKTAYSGKTLPLHPMLLGMSWSRSSSCSAAFRSKQPSDIWDVSSGFGRRSMIESKSNHFPSHRTLEHVQHDCLDVIPGLRCQGQSFQPLFHSERLHLGQLIPCPLRPDMHRMCPGTAPRGRGIRQHS